MRKGRTMRKYYRDAICKPRSDPLGSTIGNAYWPPENTRTIEKILTEVNRKMYEEKRSKGEWVMGRKGETPHRSNG